jgi:hypothetical protein
MHKPFTSLNIVDDRPQTIRHRSLHDTTDAEQGPWPDPQKVSCLLEFLARGPTAWDYERIVTRDPLAEVNASPT